MVFKSNYPLFCLYACVLTVLSSSGALAHGSDCVYLDPASTKTELEERLQSANKLISRARALNDEALNFICRGKQLASNFTEQGEVSSSDYQSLLKEYDQALSVYTEHRREYFQHCQKYHERQGGPRISSPYVPIGKLANLKPLKLKVSDKCAQLVSLEAKLLNNEKEVMTMLEGLASAMSKESNAVLGNMWMSVQSLAEENRNDAMQYNHLAIQKTSQSSSSIHDMISAANRDGILSYQKEVYGKYERNNALQSAIFQRSNMHGRYAMMVLSRLQSMKPPGVNIGNPGNPSYSGDQLQAESQELKREYAQIQQLYQKLRLAQDGK